MGNEAAAMAQGAEQSGEIIHYAATEIAPGIVINMQTMYMTWIAMAIVFVLFFRSLPQPEVSSERLAECDGNGYRFP